MPILSLHKNQNTLQTFSDEELLAIYVVSGNMEVIAEIYRRYSHLVIGVCFKYLKNEENARDATMQIFEKLITDLKSSRIEFFKSWLYSVSKNYCLMQLRHKSSEERHITFISENSSEKFVEIWDELHLNHEYDNEKRLLALNGALAQLNGEQRTCVELIYLENKSYKEIAEITGMDINHIKSHIQNGKRNLKILLEKIS